MEKTIFIEGKPIKMRVSARIHAEYRECFGADLISDLDKFQSDAENNAESIEVFENLAWLMAKKAGNQVHPPELTAKEAVAVWLDGFDTATAIVKAIKPMMDLYSAGNKTNSKKRKKSAPR